METKINFYKLYINYIIRRNDSLKGDGNLPLFSIFSTFKFIRRNDALKGDGNNNIFLLERFKIVP